MSKKKTEEKKSRAIAVNVNRDIKKRNGDPIRYPPEYKENFKFCETCTKKVNEVRGPRMTVGAVIVDVLDSMPKNSPPDEKKLTGSEKLRRGLLAEKIYSADAPIELPVEDLALIKKLVGEVQTPLVISQVFPEIDPKPEKEGD